MYQKQKVTLNMLNFKTNANYDLIQAFDFDLISKRLSNLKNNLSSLKKSLLLKADVLSFE